MADQGTPAGWFEDPHDLTKQQLRYWDGSVWTGHVAPNPAAVRPDLSPRPTGQPTPAQAAAGAAWVPQVEAGQRPDVLPPPPPAGFTGPVPPMPDQTRGLIKSKKELQQENARLRSMLEGMGVAQRDALRDEITELEARTDRKSVV